jgi:HlyD family secretion protein
MLEELNYQSEVAQARATKAELDLLYAGTRPEEIEQARARVRGAEAEVRSRSRDLDRVQALYAKQAAPVAELDAVRAGFERAVASQDEARGLLRELNKGPRAQEIEAGEARLQSADANARASEERIARHVLYADAKSEVLDVPVEYGEFVSPGTTVVTVADTERPYVDMFVPQPRIGEVRVGMAVRVSADSLAQPLGGRVEHIARTLEYTPRFLFSPRERPYLVLRVRVRVADPKRDLHAGVPAFVELEAPASSVALPPEPDHHVAPSESGAPPARGLRSPAGSGSASHER